MNPAMRRAQRHRKNTKEQFLELERKRESKTQERIRSPPKRTKPKNPAALVSRAGQAADKKQGKIPPKTGLNSSELRERKKKRITAQERKQINKESGNRSVTPNPSPHRTKVKNKKKIAPPEDFPEWHYVKATKTAKQLMEEKKRNAAPKQKMSPEEYEQIKQERLQLDQDVKKNKRTVKAGVEVKKKVVRDKQTGKKKYKYIQQDPESYEEYWKKEDYRPPATSEIKDVDDLNNRKKIDKVMKRTGRKYGPNEKVKINDDLKQIFTLEDLDPRKGESQHNIPIVDVNSIDIMINPTILKKSRRDVLLIGLSESTKDALIDVIMESKMGKKDRVFDATIMEEDNITPKDCICIYSDTVPIKPYNDKSEHLEDSEDSFDAQHKERIKKIKEKQKTTTKKSSRRSKTKKKVVIATAETEYAEEPYNLRKKYPTARFICLTKVSTAERVDLQKLHQNTANFIDFERFKKEFTDLRRFECLVIDQLNKKRLYRIEFE